MISSPTHGTIAYPARLPVPESPASPCSPEPSPVDHFFRSELQAARIKMAGSPLWSYFRSLPDSFLTYLYSEKQRLAMTAETRYVTDDQHHTIAGFEHSYGTDDDQYHPKNFQPFIVHGYWIPRDEGKSFTLHKSHCAITRTVDGQSQILFLVHPKSTTLFAPLIEKYQHSQVDIPAIALSSFRTLLIALPNSTEFAMLKVSLDQTIGSVRRLLYQKECAASVAFSAMLNNKPVEPFTCLAEDFSFVPSLVNPSDDKATRFGAGMIHRPFTQLLSNDNSHIIPLYALFGVNNWPLLNALIEQSQKPPTRFITDALLQPLATAMVDHIYQQRFYLEFHGQNVLLKLTPHPDRLDVAFIYRDMGGVNCQLNKTELQQLPESLREPAKYWEANFITDAAAILEGIAKKVLFNLTKVFFKCEHRDPDFCRWRDAMTSLGYQGNWTLSDVSDDQHQQCHSEKSFYRYGYFEKIFAHHVLEAMSLGGIFLDIRRSCQGYSFFRDEIGDNHTFDQPCITIEWFSSLVQMTLPHYRQYQNTYNATRKRTLALVP